jgi:uncharacterized membrane protein
MEVLFLALWLIFLAIKVYHPSATWGEKPMNMSFLNAVYRTAYFPPEDPWISGYGINYYYYGHALFAIIGRFLDIPASYVFNIAGPYVTALTGLGIFSLAYALSRRTFISLLAMYLCVFAGHIFSYIFLLKDQLNKMGIGFYEFFNGAGAVLSMMGTSILTYLGFADDETKRQIMGWDYGMAFWDAAHNIIFGTAATEFPYWTHLFMDFHAHMLVMPFVFSFMVLLFAYFALKSNESNLFSWIGLFFFLALTMGTVTCVNTWDLPACLIALLFASAVKFWRESELINNKTRTDWISPNTLHSMSCLPLLPIVVVPILSYVLHYPFHFHFIPPHYNVKDDPNHNGK